MIDRVPLLIPLQAERPEIDGPTPRQLPNRTGNRPREGV
jgi:hypothetical protein